MKKRRKVCIAGLGRLGTALLDAGWFEDSEFELAAGFDINADRTEALRTLGLRTKGGQSVPLYPVYKMRDVIYRFGIEIALLCVPPQAAQETAEKLAAAGIKGILNFCPAPVKVPPGTPAGDVNVRNVSLIDELRALDIRENVNAGL